MANNSLRLSEKKLLLAGNDIVMMNGLAARFTNEGAKVYVLYDEGCEAKPSADSAVAVSACKLTDSTKVIEGFEAAMTQLGELDSLVFCAGKYDGHLALEDTDDATIDSVISQNQTAAFYISREAAKAMDNRKNASILYVSSDAGITAAAGAAYVCSSSALVSMCRNNAYLFSGKGMRCNILCPGPIDGIKGCTSRIDSEKNDYGKKIANHVDIDLEPVTVEDVANAAVFFVSDESAAINGQAIQIDRGYGF